ncbi:MAG: putative HTH-type transcriptional regulator YusO [Chloroflexi bacterium ADurb.Bin325]|nr:MAG: putative HTH-type transcriptional regulator YusO [Chloroflexi bacterium ADurb.Bin325]
MNAYSEPAEDALHLVVETFWETFPPFWQHIRAHIRQAATEQFGIGIEQFQILRHIRRGRSSVSELADARSISRPAVSQIVDALVNKGLIVRTPDAHDRRRTRLALTAAGDALLDAVFKDTRRWMMQLFSRLDDEELQELVRGMHSLRKAQPV